MVLTRRLVIAACFTHPIIIFFSVFAQFHQADHLRRGFTADKPTLLKGASQF